MNIYVTAYSHEIAKLLEQNEEHSLADIFFDVKNSTLVAFSWTQDGLCIWIDEHGKGLSFCTKLSTASFNDPNYRSPFNTNDMRHIFYDAIRLTFNETYGELRRD